MRRIRERVVGAAIEREAEQWAGGRLGQIELDISHPDDLRHPVHSGLLPDRAMWPRAGRLI
jgi:hypothetical protein